MGIQERKEREKAHMRQMILETALAIFQAEGFDKVSVRAIADRIEYSPATLYLYFKNKDDIFYALHEEGFRRFIEYQRRADVLDDPAQRLKKMGQDYLNFAVENPEYYDLMFIMAAPMREVSQEWSCGKEAFENLVKAVQDCLESGQILSGNAWGSGPLCTAWLPCYCADACRLSPKSSGKRLSKPPWNTWTPC